MRRIVLAGLVLASGCATSEYEKPLTDRQRTQFLAGLPAEDRSAFETLLWAQEVDQRPILAEFNACLERELGAGEAAVPAAAIATAATEACFPIVERLVRGIAMRVPALMTGPTADVLNDWADSEAAKQRDELISTLATRVEAVRTRATPVP